MTPSLDDRLAALRTMRTSGDGRIPDALAEAADRILDRAAQRRDLSPGYTVVGLFGATGSGKSSLINAIVGGDVARTHVRRPTTSEPLAVIWEPIGAIDLLDWLDVRERVVRDVPIDPRARQLVLLDLPDFDSIEQNNRATAERLAAQVDALLWVVNPQKYADEVLHAQFVAPHARHAEVTLLVLNQIDLLTTADVPKVVQSLREIVKRDGIAKAKVIPVSARTGIGIPKLRSALGDLAAARSARDSRLAADVATLAAQMPGPARPGAALLGPALLGAGRPGETRPGTGRPGAGRPGAGRPGAALLGLGSGSRADSRGAVRLRDDVAIAAGVDTVAGAVAGSYRKRSVQVTGWPVLSWISRLRADPLTRLGLGARGKERDPGLHRSSLPPMSSAARARLSLAVRAFSDAASDGLHETWRSGIRGGAERSLGVLPDALDLALASTPLPARGSWWWPIFGVLQWIAVLAGLTGVGWLLAAAFLPAFGLPSIEIPRVEGWAVPTLLIAAAILVGILLGLLAAILSSVTAASRRRRTRRRLVTAVDGVLQELLVKPIAADLDRARAFAAAQKIASA